MNRPVRHTGAAGLSSSAALYSCTRRYGGRPRRRVGRTATAEGHERDVPYVMYHASGGMKCGVRHKVPIHHDTDLNKSLPRSTTSQGLIILPSSRSSRLIDLDDGHKRSQCSTTAFSTALIKTSQSQNHSCFTPPLTIAVWAPVEVVFLHLRLHHPHHLIHLGEEL